MNRPKWLGACLALCMTLATASLAQAQARDTDGDGVPDAVDNCLRVPNPGQLDADGDGIGNACDGDLNNDGRVDAKDQDWLKQRMGTADASADLNGDGKVDETDAALLARLIGSTPGPTGLTLRPSFAKTPPLAKSVQIFMLDTPLRDGRNAIVVADFTGSFEARGLKSPESLALNTEAGIVAVNDIGFESDEKAGDGVFTGLIRFDRERVAKDASAFAERARNKKLDRVGLFNTRLLSREVAFDVAGPFEPSAAGSREFMLAHPTLGRLVVVGRPILVPRFPLPATTDPARTLMVTHTSVVQDPGRSFSPCTPTGAVAPFGNPNGAWAFKTLMTNMANPALTGISPQVFVNNWLKKWLVADASVKHSDGVAVPWVVPARPALQGIVQSLQPGWNPNDPTTLDLDRLPFRLLAIVNRLDLASGGYLGGGEPGELRFVFGLVERSGASCIASREMTVIFEYKVPTTACLGLKDLANQWIALDALVPGSAAYNAQLQTLTNQVTLANAFPGRVNNSAIGQVRTNEIRLAAPWEIREFTLQGGAASGQLLHETVKNTPDKSWNNSALLGQFMLSPINPMPRQFNGSDLLGAAITYGPGSFPNNPPWNGSPQVANPQRFDVSLNTCSGCHLSETGTSFTHVSATGALNAPAALSRFLTGTATTAPFTAIPDAAYGAPSRHFADLQRRGQAVEALGAQACLRLPALPLVQDRRVLPQPSLDLPMFSPPFVH
jgi:hypothetical protein